MHAVGCSPILDARTLVHFGQTKASAEGDWEAARSFLPPASFLRGFMPFCPESTTGLSR